MTIDPKLQALFKQVEHAFDRDAFARAVMARIDAERRRTMLFWAGFGLVAVVVLALLAGPVLAAFSMASQFLPKSLVEIESELLRLLLSPINSVAAVIAIAALGIRKFYRRFLG